MTHQTKNKNYNGGFTIIETMIVVSLFIVITTVGMGALLNANLVFQKSQNMRSLIDNMNFVMEEMSRSLRTGYNYHCVNLQSIESSTELSKPKSCDTNAPVGWGVAFENVYGDNTANDVPVPDPVDNEDQWVYKIEAGKIFKSTNSAASFVQLTSDEIFVDPELSYFVVSGAESPSKSDFKQPLITIRLVGSITYQNVVTSFALQTTVSQRLVDI